jgi:hypothetical protein
MATLRRSLDGATPFARLELLPPCHRRGTRVRFILSKHASTRSVRGPLSYPAAFGDTSGQMRITGRGIE